MPYALVEHTGELELRVTAESRRRLFEEAVLALAAELAPDEPRGTPGVRHAVAFDARDDAALLVDLLNEVVFLAETEGFLPDAVELGAFAAGHLEAVLVGRADSAPRNVVKAATFDRLSVEEMPDGAAATVVLDV